MSPRKIRRRRRATRVPVNGPNFVQLTERELVEALDPGMVDWHRKLLSLAKAA